MKRNESITRLALDYNTEVINKRKVAGQRIHGSTQCKGHWSNLFENVSVCRICTVDENEEDWRELGLDSCSREDWISK